MNYFFLRTALHCSFIVVADACFSVFPLDVEYVLIAQSRTSCICVFVDTHSPCLRSPCVLAKKKKNETCLAAFRIFSRSLFVPPSFGPSTELRNSYEKKKYLMDTFPFRRVSRIAKATATTTKHRYAKITKRQCEQSEATSIQLQNVFLGWPGIAKISESTRFGILQARAFV